MIQHLVHLVYTHSGIRSVFARPFDGGLWSFRAAYRAGAPGAALKGM